jgi:hypothetical protein
VGIRESAELVESVVVEEGVIVDGGIVDFGDVNEVEDWWASLAFNIHTTDLVEDALV